MNTIPSIFNERQINHTILCGNEKIKPNSLNVSCILINRNSSQFRTIALENLLAKNFQQIISIEQSSESFNTAALSQTYPSVKFIITLEPVTEGDMINLGMEEVNTDYVLVIHDDLCWQNLSFNQNLFSKFMSMEKLCVAPRLFTNTEQNLPVNLVPSIADQNFVVEKLFVMHDNQRTLYPLDFSGFYNKQKYIELGGCDYTITSPYWQKLDFFLRAWLWGEEVVLSSSFTLFYSGEYPAEEMEADSSYIQFYLKNLMPVMKDDHAVIQRSAFHNFKKSTKYTMSKASELYKAAKKWTEQNQYKFKTDASSFVLEWGEK